jgi:hypothetical protein
MSQSRARIESPEVIRELRNHLAVFDQKCRNALMACSGDIQNTREWLRNDRQPYWKLQIRKREEEMTNAKRELAQAKWASEHGGRSAGVDEMRALEKAKRRFEEAQQKIETVKKWTLLLEQRISKMLGPCHSMLILLDQKVPQGISRIDQMLDDLEAYFRQAPKEAP